MNKLIGFTRSFSSSNSLNAVKTVTVIGGGLMGSGIAQVSAQAGQNVTLVDLNAETLQKALKSIENNLTRVAKKVHKDDVAKIDSFVKDSIARIKTSIRVEDGVNSDLIIEAIVEQLDVKQQLFNKLDELAPQYTILTSNTSSIPINAIGSGIKRKDRLGGLHFFNPVPVMRLIEVIKTDDMSEETHQTLMEWGKSVGDATMEDIDIGMKLGAGYPMGPFELCDYTGLDTNKHVMRVLYEMTKEEVFRPVPLLDTMVAEGKLGVKSGEGFYKYKK
ncbi:probable 3-hydroxyacyl-CoA dehydrogenase B0272.3 isoform X2 [Pieris brassicae]|uniref:probable 3-hydroxyacyl-CoA dehydrogenase B0272.3 isoform X2 n=1 Tax=Pieris brassicae TaxID=7116 RepID=UPI001E65EE0E|nr:probable 3-hydroxyacyl-CoA dehydrogenase B0272.3 isoform X2 [Pieris brassicae]